MKKRGIWRKAVVAAGGLLLLLAGAFFLYVGNYYAADARAAAALAGGDGVEVETLPGGNLAFVPEEPGDAGLIFYPGGKVESAAYAPLMRACARRGLLCVLVKMPFNLAVLNPAAADGVARDFPGIFRWYMGGHSLGGSMAAVYLADRLEAFEGLILLASYSPVDLSATKARVLSIYGDRDGVMNRENYEQARSRLPESARELVLAGGCHAYFGSYGSQKGDGTPALTNEEQIAQTAQTICAFIRETPAA